MNIYGFTIAGGDHQREVLAVLTPLPRVKYRLYRIRNHIFNVTILSYSKNNNDDVDIYVAMLL